MKIDGSKRVDNLNTQIFKGSNKDTPDNNELKQVEASAADALNAYGRAMITQMQNPKAALLKLIDETIKNYEDKLDCDEYRKGKFISELQDTRKKIETNKFKDIDFNSYLFKGYIEDDMKLVKELFNAEDEKGKFRFDCWEILQILKNLNSGNIQLFNTLLEAKDAEDEKGKFRFDCWEILQILKNLNSGNIQLFNTLLEAKDDEDENNFRFDGYDISSIFEKVTAENKDSLPLLLDAKDKEGNFRFNGSGISSILTHVTAENKDILEELLETKDKEGNLRFDGSGISSILAIEKTKNIDLFNTLFEAKDKYGNFRFDGSNISSIFKHVTDENKDSLEELLDAKKDKEGNFRFDGNQISSIFERVTAENKDIFKELFNAKDKEGNFRFDGSDISSIFKYVTAENKDSLPLLLYAKNKEGNFRFGKWHISFILSRLTDENEDIFKELFNAKDDEGNFRFDGSDISSFFEYFTPGNYVATVNKKILEELLDKKDDKGKFRFSGSEILSILFHVKLGNKNFLDELLDAKDKDGNFRFDGNEIYSILDIEKTKNIDLYNTLFEAKDKYGNFRFNGYDISSIFYNVKPENKDIFDELLDAKKDKEGNFRFNGSEISSILYNVKPENKDIFDELLDAKDKEGNFRFNGSDISSILKKVTATNKDILPILLDAKDAEGKFRFDKNNILSIMINITNDDKNKLISLINDFELTGTYIAAILNKNYNITANDVKTIEKIIGKDVTRNLNENDVITAVLFKALIHKNNINEISLKRKKELIRNLVASNTGMFNVCDELRQHIPLLPKNQEEYCELLPNLVKSLGIETNELSQSDIDNTYKEINKLSNSLKILSDEDFNKLSISQEYSSEDLIKDTFNIVKDLSDNERQKVFDYFGFELYENPNGTKIDNTSEKCFSINGYPVNLNNGKKLAQIKEPSTKAAVEKLRPYVIKFSQNNKITSNNKDVENYLNNIVSSFPELRTAIGKQQHNTHDFDVFKHSLKVMQKITQSPDFDKLNDKDKNIMLLASLFHDITKPEGLIDKTHANESAFDSFYILKKLKLPKNEEIKLYSLIKNHEWFRFVNDKEITDVNKVEKRFQSAAFDLQYDNLFDLAKIFTQADLKAVKEDNSYFDKYESDFKPACKKISNYIAELQKTQPLMPVTPIPKASKINEAITKVNEDGSTNIKGVYKNKDGLIIIKFNEVENETWEKIGFPKGSCSHGITVNKLFSGSTENINTGNIKFFAHGLNYFNQLAKFDAFALPDSDALLSVSYAERPESKYRFFRTQGVLLNTQTKYMHGGGKTDSGSGYKKDINTFKDNYIFGGKKESDRKYISNLIKDTLNMSDKKYVQFVKENADKPFTLIEPEEVRNTIIKAFSTINSNIRLGNRAYNEMYITNPEVMGVFAYPPSDKVGDIMQFIDKQPEFLKQYALEKDLPFVVFGD